MQGITAEYVRLQTGRPIPMYLSGERTPTALSVTREDIVRFFCRPNAVLVFGFLMKGVQTPGRVARKALALTF